MLTNFYKKSSFKKKFTVVTIWMIALVMMVALIKFVISTEIDLVWLFVPVIMALFVISGIILRCKIARWFTLLSIYIFLSLPLVNYLMLGEITSIFKIGGYALIALVSIYVFSNKKAMDIFYIESNPNEHIPLILFALSISGVYVFFMQSI
jgi:hypothetical protein